jgi:two-component system chemotaxis response regulator CheY
MGQSSAALSLSALSYERKADSTRPIFPAHWTELPARSKTAAAALASRGPPVYPSAAMLSGVLAIDDSSVALEMYRVLLSQYKGCRLVTATNGLDALDKLAQETGIDLIILDINMPVMNGLEFLKQIQREPAYKDIPVIIISTEGRDEDALQGLRMGAKAYIKKPFHHAELHALIKKLTGR